jgi:hypothetical protein
MDFYAQMMMENLAAGVLCHLLPVERRVARQVDYL